MNIKLKIWLEENGKVLFGLGKLELLKAIEKEGSISKASKSVGIPFRRAWNLLKDIEVNFGVKILEKKRGGKNGGYTKLTSEAKNIMEKFEKTINEIMEYSQESYKRNFRE